MFDIGSNIFDRNSFSIMQAFEDVEIGKLCGKKTFSTKVDKLSQKSDENGDIFYLERVIVFKLVFLRKKFDSVKMCAFYERKRRFFVTLLLLSNNSQFRPMEFAVLKIKLNF